MPRSFTATGHYIQCGIGNCGFAFGPGSVVAVVRRTTDDTEQVVLYLGAATSGTDRVQLSLAASNVIQLWCGSSGASSTATITAADGWVLIAATKPTGTSTVRFHKYVYATRVWTHENGGAIANSGVPATNIYIGNRSEQNLALIGDIEVAAPWSTELSDAQIEPLAHGLTPWQLLNPAGMWRLNQGDVANTVRDMTTGGAHETGRSGTSVPSNFEIFNEHLSSELYLR